MLFFLAIIIESIAIKIFKIIEMHSKVIKPMNEEQSPPKISIIIKILSKIDRMNPFVRLPTYICPNPGDNIDKRNAVNGFLLLSIKT